MTKKERSFAIEILKHPQSGDDSDIKKSIALAIQALEQESILDKISDEIMQLDYDLESVDYDYNGMAQTELVHMVCREEVLQIIDELKAEIEG